ncbi:ATP synthase subunit e, mitochondrial [Cephus cinctus]|uniref:ATP synthase F(0) complex subunit e, mitochondrial n=1 Tax=Cephus cinctus TaxID=211228 RepID=A0AAJ7C791_CEPCN|nr:ATP synthase subunit e, mitochondrial [Cephus cinctus]
MSSVELNPRPIRVSPLIKFGRWSFLGVGILYGAFHHNRLSKKEAAYREVELKQKAVRDAKLAEEKRIAAEAELRELEKLSK